MCAPSRDVASAIAVVRVIRCQRNRRNKLAEHRRCRQLYERDVIRETDSIDEVAMLQRKTDVLSLCQLRHHAPGSTHMVAIEGLYYHRIKMTTIAPDFLIGRAAVDCGQHLT